MAIGLRLSALSLLPRSSARSAETHTRRGSLLLGSVHPIVAEC